MNTQVSNAEIDFNDLAFGIKSLHKSANDDHYETVLGAMEMLRRTPLPPGYVSNLQSEMYMLLSRGVQNTKGSNVYLAFYGEVDKANHMKVGVANNIKKRMDTFKIGNPIPNLWTYGAKLNSRKDAFAIESALLKHLSVDSIHGEWFSVGGLSECAVRLIVESLTEVANDAVDSLVEFKLCEV